jgi:hypothetical protein
MTSNAARFKIELEDEFDHIMEEVLPLVLQKIAMETLSRVVLRSPVDTGRFRGNWTVSVGGPSDETLDVFDKSGGPTIARGSAAVTGVEGLQVVWIQNNLPYANRLENGWSKQAPAGMVALTVAEIETMFERVE